MPDAYYNPASSTFTELPIVPAGAAFDSRMCGFFQAACISQPRGGEKLDPIDELQMYRAPFRHFGTHDSLLVHTTVDATGKNVAGIRVSSRVTFPSIRYTSRMAGDAPGTMPGGEVERIAGSDLQSRSFHRFKTRIGAFRLPGC